MKHITSACCRTGFPLRSKPAANASVMCHGESGVIIKNAYKPPLVLSLYSNLTLFIFIILTIFSFILFDEVIGVICGFVGVICLIISIRLDHKRKGIKLSDYTKRLSRNFECPECQCVIDEKIPHENIDGVPLIYLCNSCEIMWVRGYYVTST